MVAPVKNPVVTTGFKYVSKRRPSPWKAGYHPGIDYRASVGTPTYAPSDGKIINTRYDSSYGYKVVGESTVNGRKYQWIVAHHRKGGIHVKMGQTVKAGDRIGSSGDTGNTFGAHVHFEVRVSPYGYWDHVNPSVLVNVKTGAKPSTDKMDPAAYFLGATGEHIKWLDQRLILHGFDKHHDGNGFQPGTRFTEFDRLNVRDAQLFLGFTGGGADGFPGKDTLTFLASELSTELPPDTEGPVLEDPDTPLTLLARWAWTDTKNGRADRPLDPARVTSITLHYPGDGNVTYANLTQQQVAAKLEAYRKHHVNKGWADIGYNYAIDGQGRTWFLTGDTVGAHSESVNSSSIGVLLVIGNDEEPTTRMIEAFKVLHAEKREQFTKASKVQGHRQVPDSTACPGDKVVAAINAGLFTEAPLPTPEPEPEEPVPAPEPPKPATDSKRRMLNINVCADYCASTFGSRLDNIERVRSAARASLVFTTEAGSYADGERVNRAFGWGGKRNGTVATGESFVLHGGSVPIATAAHFNPADFDVLDEGLWVTVPGTTHRWATWVLLRDSDNNLFIAVIIHCQYLPKGPNTIRRYDKERESQVNAAMEKVEDLQAKVLESRPSLGKVPALVTGDVNGKRTDDYDGPGRAASKHGYVDTATVGKDDKPIIDRTFVWGMKVLESEVVSTNGATDHETANTAYLQFNNQQ